MGFEENDDTPPPPPHRKGRVGLWTVLGTLVLFGLVVLGGLSLTGRTLIMPDVLRAEIESRLNAGLGQGSIRLGRIELAVSREGRAELLVRDVTVGDPTGAKLADLNVLRSTIRLGALLRGDVMPSAISLRGAQVTVRRDVEGRFTLSYGGGVERRARNIAGIIDELEDTLSDPALVGIEEIRADDLTVTLEDARTGRLWQASNASLRLARTGTGLSITLVSELFNGTDDLAEVQLSAQSFFGSARASFGATVSGVPAADIAVQAPALSYLGVLDAPISGAIRTRLDGGGALADSPRRSIWRRGALAAGARLRAAVPFERGRAYLHLRPRRRSGSPLTRPLGAVPRVLPRCRARAGRGSAISTAPGRRALTASSALREARIDPEGVFETPVSISDGTADFRIRLDPFLGRDRPALGGGRRCAARRSRRAPGWAERTGTSPSTRVDRIGRAGGAGALAADPRAKTRGAAWLGRNIARRSLFEHQRGDAASPTARRRSRVSASTSRGPSSGTARNGAADRRRRGRASLHDHASHRHRRGQIAGPAGDVDPLRQRLRGADIRDTPSTIALDLAAERQHAGGPRGAVGARGRGF